MELQSNLLLRIKLQLASKLGFWGWDDILKLEDQHCRCNTKDEIKYLRWIWKKLVPKHQKWRFGCRKGTLSVSNFKGEKLEKTS